MNPPASAARGAEAGNPIALNAEAEMMALKTAPAGTYPGAGSEGAGLAPSDSFFSFRDRVLSALGPVAITVRESENRDFSWIATVALRPASKSRAASGAADDG